MGELGDDVAGVVVEVATAAVGPHSGRQVALEQAYVAQARGEAEKAPWYERKRAYIAAFPHKTPAALRVSLADKLHNARAILLDYRTHGDELWSRFKQGQGLATGSVKQSQGWQLTANIDNARTRRAYHTRKYSWKPIHSSRSGARVFRPFTNSVTRACATVDGNRHQGGTASGAAHFTGSSDPCHDTGDGCPPPIGLRESYRLVVRFFSTNTGKGKSVC